MTIVTFSARKGDDLHREIASIGVVDVGYVMDLDSASGASKPHWCATVPHETARVLHVASSRNQAKRQLMIRVAEYFECMGAEFEEKASKIRSEALGLVDAA